MQETWVQSLGWEDPLEEGIATRSIFLPGESHEQRSLVGYSPWGHRVGHNWMTEHAHEGPSTAVQIHRVLDHPQTEKLKPIGLSSLFSQDLDCNWGGGLVLGLNGSGVSPPSPAPVSEGKLTGAEKPVVCGVAFPSPPVPSWLSESWFCVSDIKGQASSTHYPDSY